MRVILQVQSGPSMGRKILLRSQQTLTLGRTELADVVFADDHQMSRIHFELSCGTSNCQLRDLDSSNGTFVSGQKAVVVELADGDEIVAGQTRFSVLFEGAPPKSAGARADPPTNAAAVEPPRKASAPGETPSPPTAAPEATRRTLPSTTAAAPASSAPRSEAPQAPVQPADSTRAALRAALANFTVEADRPFDRGLVDNDPAVREQAMLAAVWTRQRWLLDYCRRANQQPSPETMEAAVMLAILGEPSDLELILSIGKNPALGTARFTVLGAYGHPQVVDYLISRMASNNAELAAAAGKAFVKITGRAIDSENRVVLPPAGAEDDEFEKEFADELALPDAAAARKHWDAQKRQFARSDRVCGGFDVSAGAADVLAQLDMQSRFEACLRDRYRGVWKGRLADVDRYSARRM